MARAYAHSESIIVNRKALFTILILIISYTENFPSLPEREGLYGSGCSLSAEQ